MMILSAIEYSSLFFPMQCELALEAVMRPWTKDGIQFNPLGLGPLQKHWAVVKARLLQRLDLSGVAEQQRHRISQDLEEDILLKQVLCPCAVSIICFHT